MTTSFLILARAFHYESAMLLVGVMAFRWWILLPALVGQEDSAWQSFRPFLRRLNQLFVGAGVVVVLSGLLWFWTVAAGMSDCSLAESFSTETLGAVFGKHSLAKSANGAWVLHCCWSS